MTSSPLTGATLACALGRAHPPAAVPLSLTEDRLFPLDKEGQFLLGEVPVTEDGEDLVAAVSTAKVALLRGHGFFAAGDSLEEVLHLTTALEFSARTILLNRLWPDGNPRT